MSSVGGHVTLNIAISAAGKVIAPLVIFSKNLPRDDFTDGIPEEWTFAKSDSGYINNDIFTSWFSTCFVKQCGRGRPVLAIMDNLSSHLSPAVIDIAQQENIELLCLPAHSTHLLQPLDVGYYHLLKQHVATLSTALGYTGLKTIPRHKFPKLVHLAVNKIAGSTVSASFSSVGIFPFNPAKVSVDCSTDQHTSTAQQSGDQLACETCGHMSKENHLVRLGLIPASLKNILAVPDSTKSKRVRYDSARVITGLRAAPEPTPSTSMASDEALGCKTRKHKQSKSNKKQLSTPTIPPPPPYSYM